MVYKPKKMMIIALAFFLMSLAMVSLVSAQYDWDDYDYGYSNEAAAGLFGFGVMMCIVVCLIPIIIGLLIGIWVYKDAEKRGKSGILWFFIVLVLGIIGLIIWIVVRPPIGGEKGAEPDRRCPNCGRAIPTDARVCPYCNKNFEQK